MADTPSNEVVLVHLTYLREQMDEVVGHLRAQNGKLEEHAKALADHDIKFAVLDVRESSAHSVSRNTSARWGAGAGAFIGGAILAIWQYFAGGK